MNKTRRSLVCTLGKATVAIPLGALFLTADVVAADTPRLSPDDPAAMSLGYTHESGDNAKRCAGCQFYTASEDIEWGSCVIFPGKLVNAGGLCQSWYAKA